MQGVEHRTRYRYDMSSREDVGLVMFYMRCPPAVEGCTSVLLSPLLRSCIGFTADRL
jgi:hypothetical protein